MPWSTLFVHEQDIMDSMPSIQGMYQSNIQFPMKDKNS